MPPVRLHLLVALLSTSSLLAGAREDLDRYQELEAARRAGSASIATKDRAWAKRFEEKYRKLFKRAPSIPEPLLRQAREEVQSKKRAGRKPSARKPEAPKPRARAAKVLGALGAASPASNAPLARQIPIPASATSPRQIDGLLAKIKTAADPRSPDKWAGGLAPALEYWALRRRAAFEGELETAFLLAVGFKKGLDGFPRNASLGKLFGDYAKGVSNHKVKQYLSTHSNYPGGPMAYQGAVPPMPSVPAGIPEIPPPEVLAWGRSRGVKALTNSQREALEKGKLRNRFYTIVDQLRAGADLAESEKKWARDYERTQRGLAAGAPAPQVEEALQAGAPARARRQAAAARERERIATENKAFYAAEKIRKEISSDFAGWYKLRSSSQKEALLGKIAQAGSEWDWSRFMSKIQPHEVTQKMVSLYWSVAGNGTEYTRRAREMENAYARNQGASRGQPRATSGYTPSRSRGPSLYDQASQAQKRYEQYQKDSFSRGGNPNSWNPRW